MNEDQTSQTGSGGAPTDDAMDVVRPGWLVRVEVDEGGTVVLTVDDGEVDLTGMLAGLVEIGLACEGEGYRAPAEGEGSDLGVIEMDDDRVRVLVDGELLEPARVLELVAAAVVSALVRAVDAAK